MVRRNLFLPVWTFLNISNIERAFLSLLQELLRILGASYAFGIRRLKLFPLQNEDLKNLNKRRQPVNWISTFVGPEGIALPQKVGLAPAIGYLEISRAKIAANPRLSAVLSGNLLLHRQIVGADKILRVPVSRPPKSGVLLARKSEIIARTTVTKSIPSAIFVGSQSPHNWYHWLIDTLPAVYLSGFLPHEFDNFPVLIPEQALGKKHWEDLLGLCLGDRGFEVLEENHYLEVDRLIWIQGPTARVEASGLHGRPQFAIDPHTMNEFRAHILNRLELSPTSLSPSTRVFLARKPGGLRKYNQDEILEIAIQYGFTPLFQEEMTIAESLNSLLHAEYIIGPHGAGWATSLFADRAKKALMWTWDEATTENWFTNVLAVRGIEAHVVYTGSGSNASSYYLRPATFEHHLRRLIISENA